jgi:hypothetical protein
MERVFAWKNYGDPAPYEVIVWDMAQRFGWTLEYIEGLKFSRLCELASIDEAKAKPSLTQKPRKHGR